MLACLLAWNAAMALKQLRVARFEQFSFKPIISAERVWTPREFQTVGAAAQNALAANDIVAGCC